MFQPRLSESLLVLCLVALTCVALPAVAQPAVPVTVVGIIRRDVPVQLRAIGTVQAFQSVTMRARVDGTLDKVMFTEGQEVHPGDLLAQIDPRPYQATLDQAMAKKAADTAQLGNLQNDLSRYSEVARNGFASRQQVDTQRSSVSQQEATLKGDDAAIAAAQLNLGYTRITSPIDGRVGLRLVDAGNLIRAADTTSPGIVSITQIKPISTVFTLPQDQLPRVQNAMRKAKLPVLAFSSDDKQQLSAGELLTVDNAIDAATGTIRLKAVFANTDETLWPGQFVNVRLQVQTLTNVLTVPSAALQRGQAGLYVYVVKPDNTAAVQGVEVAQDDGQVVVVSKGLDGSEKVVLSGQSRLTNGTKVAATDAKPGA